MKRNKGELIKKNLLLKAKLILKGGLIREQNEVPPEIENEFLKNVLEFEETEPIPMYQHLHIKPNTFPAEKNLNDEELEEQYKRFEQLLNVHNIVINLQPGLPLRLAYKYLTEEALPGKYTFVKGMTLHLDGCDGYCPDCFQADYCHIKDAIWSKEELEKEREKNPSDRS